MFERLATFRVLYRILKTAGLTPCTLSRIFVALSRSCWLVLLAACSSAATAPPRSETPTSVAPSPRVRAPASDELARSPTLQPLAWLLGTWSGNGAEVTFAAVEGAIYGVEIGSDGHVDLVVLDDGEGRKPADGTLRCFVLPGAEVVDDRPCALHDRVLELDDTRYSLVGDGLSMTRGARTVVLSPASPSSAPAIAAADRAFSQATREHGVAGWVGAFATDGAMISEAGKIAGAKAIEEEMSAFLAAGTLAWAPNVSGQHAGVGYTIGKATYTPKSATAKPFGTTYVTLWKREGDAWKVARDTGRAVNAP